MTASQGKQSLEKQVQEFQETFQALQTEVGKVIVGMNDVVEFALASIFANGHALLEGVPGLGKTLLVKSIAQAFGLTTKRIQFTPDLMPSDITGTEVLQEDADGKRRFVFKRGPVFANIILADEINRATPKTQAALLEAMAERQITVMDTSYPLENPFFVLATQNPIELEGTYPLPEAQLDRFLVKILVSHPSVQEMKEVLRRTTGTVRQDIQPVFSPQETQARIFEMQQLVRQVIVADPMLDVLLRILSGLVPESPHASSKAKTYIRFGPGPRAAQSVMMLGKVFSLLDGRINLAFEDLQRALPSALRHRLVLHFQAESDGITADDLIAEIVKG